MVALPRRASYDGAMWDCAEQMRGRGGAAGAFRPLLLAHAAWLAVSLVLLVVGLGAPALAQARQADVVRIDAIISPITERYLERAIDEADRNGAEAVVVVLDTPGGLLGATRGMVEDILGSPVPIVVYVAPSGAHAASAGTFITAAAHVAAMAPGTNIGAASPVGGGGEELDETIKSKVFQDAAAEMRAIAEVRGRPVEPLEATVLEAKSYTANEALELGVVDYVAGSIDQLLTAIDGAEVVLMVNGEERAVTLATAGVFRREASMGLFDRLLSYVADPNVSYLLITLGGLGLFVEIWSPGLIFPGVLGLMMLVVGLMALGSLPGNWAGVALILMAFALISAEMFVDGFGVLGILGTVCLVLGGVLLFWHFGTPSPVLPNVAVSPWVLAPVGATVGLGVLLFAKEAAHARRAMRTAPLPESAVVGETGAVSDTIPRNGEGRVRVRGETWSARAPGGARIERGAQIVVKAERGAVLEVERRVGPPEAESDRPPNGEGRDTAD